MGTSYAFACPNCNYEVDSCGKLDSGMYVVVEPHICMGCNELSDVAVGTYGYKKDRTEIIEDGELDFYKCINCKSENIVPWDIKKKPCPKCGNKMKKGKEVILWD